MNRSVTRMLVALAAVFGVLLATVSVAEAAEVENGSFETDDFTGWTTDEETGAGEWEIVSGPGPEDIGPPPCGTFAAATDQGEPDSNILYQDIELEEGMTHTLTLQYAYDNGNTGEGEGEEAGFFTPDSLSLDEGPNQQFRIDVIDPAADPFSVASADVLEAVFRTETGDPNVQDWVEIEVDLSAYAGETVRLRFAVVVTEAPLNGGVDCVEVLSEAIATTTTTAPPATAPPVAQPAPVVAVTPAFTG
jgi:hypothetical protein